MAITSPGAVDYHLAVQSGTLSLNQLNPITFMCWINAQTWGGTVTNSMVGFYTNATTGGSGIQIGTRAGSTCEIWYWGGTVLISSAGGTGVTTLTNGVWYHIAYTYDGTNNRLYINGTQTNTNTTAQLAGTNSTIYVNGFPTGTANETGIFSVADISVYNRTLSANEILTSYTTAGDKDGLWYGLQTCNPLNEGYPGNTANSCVDYSGNGNTLTPIGAATGVNFVYVASPITNDTRQVQG